MSIKDYLRACGWDFGICLVISACLGLVNSGAFFVNANLQFNPFALLLVAAAFLAVLFFAAYSRKTVIPGAAGCVVLLIALCVGSHALFGEGSIISDSEENPAIFMVIMGVCTTITFLMTRRRWLTRVFFVAVVLDVCFVEFMYKQHYWYALVIALIMAGAMVVYRNYRTNLRSVSTENVSFTSAFAVGAVFAAAIVGIGCLLFLVIIAPLNPGALEIKLFTRYMNYETVEMTGVGDTTNNQNPDNKTSSTNDTTMQSGEEPENKGEQEQEEDTSLSPLDQLGLGALLDMAANGLQSLRDMFNYLMENPAAMALFLVVLLALLAAPFVVKQRLRARWFAKTCALSPIKCVERFYLFFMKRFKMLKVVKPEEATLQEFATSINSSLQEFAMNDAGADFAQITDIYSRGVYGRIEPTDTELESYKAFYKNFYKAFASMSGKPKYALRYFRV